MSNNSEDLNDGESDRSAGSGTVDAGQANQDELFDAPLNTGTVGYAIGEIRSDVGSLKTSILEVKDNQTKLAGAGLMLFLFAMGAGGALYKSIQSDIAKSEENTKELIVDIQDSIEELDGTVRGVNERLIKVETSSAESLSRIEQTLGTLVTKVDEQLGLELDEMGVMQNMEDPSNDVPATLPDILAPDNSSYTSCTHAATNEVRTVALIYDSAHNAVPCELVYGRGDDAEVVASALRTKGHCENLERKVVRNLVSAGWRCTHTFTGDIARDKDNPIVAFREDLYALDGGDLSTALTNVDIFSTPAAVEKSVEK